MRGKEERLFILVLLGMGSIEGDDQAEAVDAFNFGFGVAKFNHKSESPPSCPDKGKDAHERKQFGEEFMKVDKRGERFVIRVLHGICDCGRNLNSPRKSSNLTVKYLFILEVTKR
jgi:hypothetical protein